MNTDWQRQYEMVQLNIVALMQLSHCYLKDMTVKGKGRILNLSSVAAYCAGPDMSVYYASKAFVKSFSEALSAETEGTGVTVTALCPGPTATGFEKSRGRQTDHNVQTCGGSRLRCQSRLSCDDGRKATMQSWRFAETDESRRTYLTRFHHKQNCEKDESLKKPSVSDHC